MPNLQPFDGKDVLSTTVAISNAGDGLSAALKVDPVEMHHGDKVFVVLECLVNKVRFDPIKDTDALQRVHMLKAGTAVIVDEDVVASHLDQQRKRLEEAAGIQRLQFEHDRSKEDDPLGLSGDAPPLQVVGDDDDEAVALDDDDLDPHPPADPDDAAWEQG